MNYYTYWSHVGSAFLATVGGGGRAGVTVKKSGLAIRSFAHFAQIKCMTVSDSLRSLKTNERLWANRSGCSRQMSDRERIAQVAHNKWATVSDSLRLLLINERMRDSLKKCWLKKLKILFFCMFCIRFLFSKLSDSLIPSLLMSNVSKLPRSLTKNEGCGQIAQVAHQKWATLSDSLRSQTKNEGPWVNRSSCSPKMSERANRLFFFSEYLFC